MKGKFKKIVCAVLALCSMASVSFVGCGESAPKGFVKAKAENIFWEDYDGVEKNAVRPNLDLMMYNYAPSIIEVDSKTRYAYYCSNRATQGKSLGENYMDALGNDKVTDYIACRKGVKVNGSWYWGERTYVISPLRKKTQTGSEMLSDTEGTQTCDPNVVKGTFTYDGKEYPYLMAYLACSTRNNENNHVCLAVAEKPEGPWKRCSKINPLLRYDGPAQEYGVDTQDVPQSILDSYKWGFGQASMISVDKKGRVLMFYSAIKPFYNASKSSWTHMTVTQIRRYDFTDLNVPVCEEFNEHMNCEGIKRTSVYAKDGKTVSQVPTVTNGDYAYDPKTNRIYGITDGSMNANDGRSYAPVFYIGNVSKSGSKELGDVFFDMPTNYAWTTIGSVCPKTTKYARAAHNTCIVRDAYGWLKNGKTIETVISTSIPDLASDGTPVPGCNYLTQFAGDTKKPMKDALYTYRLLSEKISVK